MSIDPREYRNTVGCFATGITVITTRDKDGDPVGLTANSFTSLSLDPPLVLFCIDRTVQSFDAFHANRHFAVNILAAHQEEISTRFASSGPDKWNGVEYGTRDTGCPILPGCLANLECEISTIHEGGDHVIIIGEVVGVCRADPSPGALLFYKGQYAQIDE